jgi:hypothetical protein
VRWHGDGVFEKARHRVVDEWEMGLDFAVLHDVFGGAEVFEGDDVVQLLLKVEVSGRGLILGYVSLAN